MKWIPIPLYQGKYFINERGDIQNSKNHQIKPIITPTGTFVELRLLGQRERARVDDLYLAAWGYPLQIQNNPEV